MTLGTRCLVTALALMLSACGSNLERQAFVESDRQIMPELPGFPSIRYWGDMASESLAAEMGQLIVERSAGVVAEGRITALALSGGADFGAFSAGVLKGWTERGDRPNFVLVTGVSTGALIAPFAFVGPDWDDEIIRFYTSVTDEDIAQRRWLVRAFDALSLADPQPLRDTLEELVTSDFLALVAAEHELGRRLWIGTTNLDSRRPVIWDMGKIAGNTTEQARQLFIDVMIASASVPGAFPPVLFDTTVGGSEFNEMHVDGGLTMNVISMPNLYIPDIINRNVAVRDLPRQIFIIVNNKLRPVPSPVDASLLEMAEASISTLIAWNTLGNTYRIYLQSINNDLEYNIAFIPGDVDTTTQEGTFFDPVVMRRLADLGYQLILKDRLWASSPPGLGDGVVDTSPPALQVSNTFAAP